MEKQITEIPSAPDSLTTGDSRELFIDLCEDAIQQGRLTPETLEKITGFCFNSQIAHIAERQMTKHPSSIHPWYEVYTLCVNRELELFEALGLTPQDRKNLGL